MRALEDRSPGVRLWAAYGLSGLGEALRPELEEFIGLGKRNERGDSSRILLPAATRRTLETLAPYVEGAEPDLVEDALRALEGMFETGTTSAE